MKNTLQLIIFCAFVANTFSQSKKVADRYYDEFAYPKAAQIYEAIYKKGDSTKYIISRIADSYYKNAQTDKSAFWYEKLITIHNPEVTEEERFHYAQSLRANGNYKKSDAILATLDNYKSAQVKEKTEYLLDESNNKNTRISVRNLAINTEFSDFGGFMYNNEVFYASSSPRSLKKQKLYKWNNQPFLNIYKSISLVEKLEDSEKDTILELEGKKILPVTINTQFHESNPVFTKDGLTMYFTRVNSIDGKRTKKDKKKTINLKIYRASLIDNIWANIYELPFNSDQYSVGHPALSPDEKTLYFTSDMPGSIGKTDIFKVAITEDGYGEPVNLGNVINTPDREMFPYMGKDSTLYFSSNGHIGLGLLDIFQSKMVDENTFKKPNNLQHPFNSKRDDFAFYIDDKGKKGFFSSNREKGKGDDDIYSFYIYTDIPKPKPEPKPDVCVQTIQGIVKEKRSGAPINAATVKLIDSKGQVISEFLTKADGAYAFKDIPCSQSFRLTGDKLDHKSDRTSATTTAEKGGVVDTNLTLRSLIVGNKIAINPIYFDFNKSNIRPDAQYELEDVVTVMNNHPDMVIKIESHTDSRGSKTYNRSLSDRRAKSTRDYIVSRGIPYNRIESARGYGEDRLLNHCDDAHRKKCSEEEHQLNRRSYFIIVSGGADVEVQDKKPTVIDRKGGRYHILRKRLKDKLIKSRLIQGIQNSEDESVLMDIRNIRLGRYKKKNAKCTKNVNTCNKAK